MKKIYSIICGIALLAGGCNYLDIVPEDDVKSIETVFEQRAQVDKWVATCYRNVGSYASIPSNVAYTGADELVGNDNHRYSSNPMIPPMEGLLIGDGAQSVLSPLSDSWTNDSYYATIRYCNTFFEHIDETHNMEQEEKDLWTAEVKAVKAYYYFLLMRKYGPIVLLDHTIDVKEETAAMKLPRRHVDTCFNEIVRLLDEALEVLPLKAEKEAMRQGYFCRESALALKAIVRVYQASPLFNGNPNYASFRNRAGEPLFSSSVDREKWRIAAEACDEAIRVATQESTYELVEGNSGEGTELLNTIKDIEQSVQAPASVSSEIIMMAKQTNEAIVKGHHYYAYTLPYFCNDLLLNNPPSDGSLSPSMKMVEMYYTKNGLPIDVDKEWDYERRYQMDQELNASYYERVVPANTSVLKLHLEREPRFYANIACDRLYWRGIVKDQLTEGQSPLIVQAYRGETFGTNLSTLQPDMNQNRTGYWLTKFIFMDLMVDNYADQVASKGDIPMPIIRLAQLYLMSSEAWNEYLDNPTDSRVLAGINKVRARAGIPDVVTSWRDYSTNPEMITNQAGMRQIIHREMAIELAFEGQRFWDLRRWLEADVLAEPQYGWNVVATDADGFYNNGQGPIVVWSQRGFQSPRDYFWPINSKEVITSGIVQNPGW